jgi:hypothetical protein
VNVVNPFSNNRNSYSPPPSFGGVNNNDGRLTTDFSHYSPPPEFSAFSIPQNPHPFNLVNPFGQSSFPPSVQSYLPPPSNVSFSPPSSNVSVPQSSSNVSYPSPDPPPTNVTYNYPPLDFTTTNTTRTTSNSPPPPSFTQNPLPQYANIPDPFINDNLPYDPSKKK